jgi:D-alanyl-D-alanine carboxypeptidase (penicillin-binding protein 5/6)
MMSKLTRLLLIAILLPLTGCKDEVREAELLKREQASDARIAEAAKREADADKLKQEAIGIEAKLKEKEAELAEFSAQMTAQMAAREKELAKLEKEMKAAKVSYETKLKRGPVPDVTAERVIVISPDEDEVLWERNADRKGAIASTTKILTATILIESGGLDEILTVEEIDGKCAPVKIGLRAGEKYTRRNLLTALMVKSSNDIARALARDNAGSIELFVNKMNARAKELGCQDALFINPNGLPPEKDQPEPYCSARDLARLAAHADKLPELRAMVNLKTYEFALASGKKVILENTNRVLRTCDYCDGMKTGFTQAAGYCLVATGERDGKRRIVVVLNGTQSGVWRDAELLLMWALKA